MRVQMWVSIAEKGFRPRLRLHVATEEFGHAAPAVDRRQLLYELQHALRASAPTRRSDRCAQKKLSPRYRLKYSSVVIGHSSLQQPSEVPQ